MITAGLWPRVGSASQISTLSAQSVLIRYVQPTSQVYDSLTSPWSQVFDIVKASADAKKTAFEEKAKRQEQRTANRSRITQMQVDVYNALKCTVV